MADAGVRAVRDEVARRAFESTYGISTDVVVQPESEELARGDVTVAVFLVRTITRALIAACGERVGFATLIVKDGKLCAVMSDKSCCPVKITFAKFANSDQADAWVVVATASYATHTGRAHTICDGVSAEVFSSDLAYIRVAANLPDANVPCTDQYVSDVLIRFGVSGKRADYVSALVAFEADEATLLNADIGALQKLSVLAHTA